MPRKSRQGRFPEERRRRGRRWSRVVAPRYHANDRSMYICVESKAWNAFDVLFTTQIKNKNSTTWCGLTLRLTNNNIVVKHCTIIHTRL